MLYKINKIKVFALAMSLLMLSSVGAVFAQDMQVRQLSSGKKYKVEGVVVAMTDDSFLVRDVTGNDTKVMVMPSTSIKTNSFWGSGDSYAVNSIVRGLTLKAEGRGDSNGALAATKIRFDKSNLEVAQTVDSRISPAEERLTAAEQNAERVSGQIDELMAISNAARGGAKAAQDSADAAIAGVNATNQRISSLDEFVVQNTSTVNFRVGSSKLSRESQAELDNVAAMAMTMRGYYLEITGFASADGSTAANKRLSQQRAQAVIDYLITTHNVPLRRIGQSYGYGETNAIADNSTRDGRAENRRVEVKILVSRGLNQNVEVRPADPDDDGTR